MDTTFGRDLGLIGCMALGLLVLLAPLFLGRACKRCKENTWDYDSWPNRRICTNCGAVEDTRK